MLKDAITCPLLRWLTISFIGFSAAVLGSDIQRGKFLGHGFSYDKRMKSSKTWSEIFECPSTGFADSFRLRTLIFGFGRQAITGVKMRCVIPGTSERRIVKDSIGKGDWLEWQKCHGKGNFLKEYTIHVFFQPGFHLLQHLWMRCYQDGQIQIGDRKANDKVEKSDARCGSNKFFCGGQLQKGFYYVLNLKILCCEVGTVLPHRFTDKIKTSYWEVIIQCPFPNLVKRIRVKAIELSSGSYKITGIKIECKSQTKFTGKVITRERKGGVWHPWIGSINEDEYLDGYNVKFKSPPIRPFSWASIQVAKQIFKDVLLNLHLTSNKGETWSGIVGSNDDGAWTGYLKCQPETGVCGFQLLYDTRLVRNVQAVCCVL